jgi:ActR/RegA family two-component response regulator
MAMPETCLLLRNCRLLVVEDDYFLADDLARGLQELGAEVVGQVGSVDDALNHVVNSGPLDGALLDINLRGERVFPVAEALFARDVPFVFTTGYDQLAIPAVYTGIPVCNKPTNPLNVAKLLCGQMKHRRAE